MLGRYYNLKNKINTLIYKSIIRFRYPNFEFGENLRIVGRLCLGIRRGAVVNIGTNVIFRAATPHDLGFFKPVSINILKNAELLIGDNTGFTGTTLFISKKVVIGKYCNFGGNTTIWDTDFHPIEFKGRRIHDETKIKSSPVIIGDDVFVGANSMILKGVTIGDRAIIGAGSIVIRDIPADEIWTGNPAKFLTKILNSN